MSLYIFRALSDSSWPQQPRNRHPPKEQGGSEAPSAAALLYIYFTLYTLYIVALLYI